SSRASRQTRPSREREQLLTGVGPVEHRRDRLQRSFGLALAQTCFRKQPTCRDVVWRGGNDTRQVHLRLAQITERQLYGAEQQLRVGILRVGAQILFEQWTSFPRLAALEQRPRAQVASHRTLRCEGQQLRTHLESAARVVAREQRIGYTRERRDEVGAVRLLPGLVGRGTKLRFGLSEAARLHLERATRKAHARRLWCECEGAIGRCQSCRYVVDCHCARETQQRIDGLRIDSDCGLECLSRLSGAIECQQ